MNPATHDRWLHRFAVITAVVSLLPIGMGALVTTLDAGMAFLDWPTSDGHNMFLYPWLQDLHANRDKFVEHGHRLAGSLIGLFSIGLAVFAQRRESRGWVRGLAFGILTGVIVQGLLGGFRVIADARIAALVHGTFASLIFSAITVFALVTSARWRQPVDRESRATGMSLGLKFLALVTPFVILLQSLVGGLIRHLGIALHEHLAGGVLTTFVAVAMIAASWRTGQRWLRSAAAGLAVVLLVQLLFGAGAWVTRFGFPPTGYVAVQQAPEQVLFRTSHTIAAMFVLMCSIQLTVRVWRLNWLRGGGSLETVFSVNSADCESLVGRVS
jgi:cytochrome c oxidase assembly protein subunit 15